MSKIRSAKVLKKGFDMDRTIAETMELVGHRLQEARGKEPITRAEIVRAVVDDCGCSTSCVLPSDHCYNRTNDGVNLTTSLCFFTLAISRPDYTSTLAVTTFIQGP